ncbi:hypothetical protein BC831DRAFT_509925 [Entophlyctis helioformis]|nr:hypothetical protein BC831DRAFT_509925 [Entophlyctis helioformis]
MAILPKPQSALISVATWSHSAQQKVGPALEQARQAAIASLKYTQAVLKRYPPLMAFLVAIVLFSAIPLGTFAAFGLTSGAIVLGTAGTGVAIVQGSLLAIAGFFLFWFLLGALFFAGLTTFWFSAAYLGYKSFVDKKQ